MEAHSLVVKDIPLELIDVSQFNTRKDLGAGGEDSSLKDLADSIARQGLLSPVTVRPAAGGRWELVAGQRRYLACKSLGWQAIPAIVHERLDDTAATSLSLIENVHRADMHPLDKARAFLRLLEEKGSIAAVAKETGFTEQTIHKYLDLTRLPEQLRAELSTTQGPIGIEALSTLTRTFTNEEEALQAYQQTRGFSRDVQKEILRRSGGDLSKLSELAAQAQEGLFNTRLCKDGFCFPWTSPPRPPFARPSSLTASL